VLCIIYDVAKYIGLMAAFVSNFEHTVVEAFVFAFRSLTIFFSVNELANMIRVNRFD